MTSVEHLQLAHTHITRQYHEIDIIRLKLRSFETKSNRIPEDRVREKVSLLRRLNMIQSPIGKLPFDVLSSIFKLVCANPSPKTHLHSSLPFAAEVNWLGCSFHVPLPVELGKVSSQWREVAWSTPALWVYASFMDQYTGRRRNPMLVKLHLENSKNLPLHLAFSYDHSGFHGKEYKYKSDIFDNTVDSMILANLPRVQSLVLYKPSIHSRWFKSSVIASLKNLVEASITATLENAVRTPPHNLRLDLLQSLQRLSLREADYSDRTLSKVPSSLTFLDLRQISIDTCIKILSRCHKIIYVQVQDAEEPYVELSDALAESWFGHQVTFPAMKAMSWEQSGYEWEKKFFNCICTPVLRELRFTEAMSDWIGQDEDLDAMTAQFFRQASYALQTLELKCLRNAFHEYPESYISFFTSNSSIENLVLISCCDRDWKEIITQLTPPPSRNDSKDNINMPRLKSIPIYGYTHWEPVECMTTELDVLEPEYFEPLVPMLSRRLVPGDHFRLKFSGILVDWTPNVQAGLRQLVEAGVDLEIIEDEIQADWLR